MQMMTEKERKENPWKPLFAFDDKTKLGVFMPQTLCFVSYTDEDGALLSLSGQNPRLETVNDELCLVLDPLEKASPPPRWHKPIPVKHILDAKAKPTALEEVRQDRRRGQ